MRQIDDFFYSEINDVLYHYTGIGALLKIVESRKLWASHAYYLNDSVELIHGSRVLMGVALERINRINADDDAFLFQLIKWLETFSDNAYGMFIFSLSEEASLLSQWRSYTPHGKGVSIGFSPTSINQLLRTSGFRIAKCVYETADQVALMDILLDQILTTFRQRRDSLDTSQEHPSQKYFGFLESFRGDILQALAILKHAAFKEEREWRVISPYFSNYTAPEIRYREGASMLVPYIELDLVDSPDQNPLFERVIVGPSQHANISINALAGFLTARRVCNVTGNSMIPYREW